MTDLETILQNGGVVILPTETACELFVQAMSENVVEHVYQPKRRPKDKAMNLNVADFETILAFLKQQPSYLKKLYDAFLPGPLAIILQTSGRVPAQIDSGLSIIGLRIPNYSQTLKSIKKAGPLIDPSANVSGQGSGKVFKEIRKQFGGTITGLVNGAVLAGADSTISDLSGKTARILRQGVIIQNDLLAVVSDLTFTKGWFLGNSSHTASALTSP